MSSNNRGNTSGRSYTTEECTWEKNRAASTITEPPMHMFQGEAFIPNMAEHEAAEGPEIEALEMKMGESPMEDTYAKKPGQTGGF